MTPIVFARITKVDEASRTVTGRAAQEVVDRTGEIFDYATSVPEFRKWSAEVYQDSGGKSYGNVRSMHGNVAAGKLTDITFNDAEKAIDIVAKIIDDNEWSKILSGVFTGFSIGGTYKKRAAEVVNGKMVTRYTAVPSEISLVDRPAIPTAKFFSVTKSDGTTVRREFANVLSTQDMHKAATDAIRQIRARGPQRVGELAKTTGKGKLKKSQRLAEQVVTGLQEAGVLPTPLLRFLVGNAFTDGGEDALLAIKKALRPAVANPGLPIQSDNAANDSRTANTGATNNWKPNPAPDQRATVLSRQPPRDISHSPNIDAATAAIAAIHKAGPNKGGL